MTASGHFETKSESHRCPSSGPVLLHDLTFLHLAFVLNSALGSPECFQDRRPLLAANRFPPKRSAKATAPSGNS
jgi:hypothetical protein